VTTSPGPPQPPREPPDTKITKAKVSSAKRRATFRFLAVGEGGAFQCELKARRHPGQARFSSCISPKTYRHLKPGRYAFEVRAVGTGGVDPSPATRSIAISCSARTC
jgi:hypothetical protein